MKLAFGFIFCTLMTLQGYAHPETNLRKANLNASLETHPHEYQLYLERGDLHRNNKNFTSADKDYESAKLTGAPLEIFLQRKALLMIAQKQFKTAIPLLQVALSIEENKDEPNPEQLSLLYLTLAEINVNQGNWLEAANQFVQVYQLNQKADSSVYLMAADLYVRAGKNHYPEAVKALEAGLEQHPKMLCMHKKLIIIESEMLLFKSAMTRLLSLFEQQPKLLHKGKKLAVLNCEMNVNYAQVPIGMQP